MLFFTLFLSKKMIDENYDPGFPRFSWLFSFVPGCSLALHRFILDFRNEKWENPGPGQLLCASYSKIRVCCILIVTPGMYKEFNPKSYSEKWPRTVKTLKPPPTNHNYFIVFSFLLILFFTCFYCFMFLFLCSYFFTCFCIFSFVCLPRQTANKPLATARQSGGASENYYGKS